MCLRAQKTVLRLIFKKILGRTFLKYIVTKESFLLHQMLPLFSTINLAYVLEINIFGKDYSNLRHLRHLKKLNGTTS